MTENEKKKKKFRQSKRWKDFRHRLNVKQNGVCFITKSKLRKLSAVHHMDLNPENYDDLNEENFVFVLHSIHETIHVLYQYYKKDPTVLDRLKIVLEKMKELNS
jgi:hypothetical protein